MKFIVVTGGVMSGLGKGITAASTGRILKNRGFKVTAIKIDPYINIDAGTMSPYQHGEVFVLKDGGEVDLDLGNYERFLDIELTRDHNITTGKVYQSVIDKERRGDYLGKTVQIIPHITNEIKERIRKVAKDSGAEICIIEVGGTVGDIESMPFLEAVRQMHREENEEDIAFLHVTLVPMDTQGEQKTKPTQHSVKELRSLGLQPDVIVARCKEPLLSDTKAKIGLFCDVPTSAVVSAHDANDIYYVPSLMEKEGLSDYLMKKLMLSPGEKSLEWDELMGKMAAIDREIRIGVVGKYSHLGDSYISINEALKHAGIECGCRVRVDWVDAEEFEKNPELIDTLKKYNGILVPGGFGVRGTEGKIMAIKYARENNVPYLGLCLGMQLAVIEFARNVVGLLDANSSELVRTEHPVIDILPEQENVTDMGGTMRLGNYDAELTEGSLASKLYNGSHVIIERHRHRYEVNPVYIKQIEEKGMKFTGRNKKRMEIAEIPGHMFFFSSQFHPEFKSRPGKPSPPFLAFVGAALEGIIR
ncbi:MAG: CTP synthase (glutamine hydrolyzing) [Candidatus Methanoperedens sp.]|nr:CTP synthase (glutamine hydrolyzing) [Candidatus Methanoperedens sp.]PKL52995.1 MAG: CTP synthetase [Candidatus Methanoperedenaceae archaeon HGW-Methanoperedenaceae-1]